MAVVRRIIEGTDVTKHARLVPAVRAILVAAQKPRLPGRDLTGQFECSFASYNYVHKMLVENQVFYLAPRSRTEQMRKWMQISLDLKDDETQMMRDMVTSEKKPWCGPSLQREVEVLVNFAEGAQTVSSFKFAGRVLRWRSPENLQILTV